MAEPVWFWQRIVSPHMAGLAAALAATGRDVTYVAEQAMSPERAAQGWSPPDLGTAQLRLAPTADAATALVRAAPSQSIHICQGFRANGVVGAAQLALAEQGLRYWVIMETVDDRGWRRLFKRLEYRRLIWQWRSKLAGILAIGDATSAWLIDRGIPAAKVFPFAYFLRNASMNTAGRPSGGGDFQFLFVGRLIELKRLDLLLEALSRLIGERFTLSVVGAGPLEASLRSLSDRRLPGQVDWLGARPIDEIPALMAQADCLVLPSSYDGWGAVVSEALMVGTPVICSDAVGAAGVVRASDRGGVFPADDAGELADLLRLALSEGRQTEDERAGLAKWSRRIGAYAGACYLDAILSYATGNEKRPIPPWLDVPQAGA